MRRLLAKKALAVQGFVATQKAEEIDFFDTLVTCSWHVVVLWLTGGPRKLVYTFPNPPYTLNSRCDLASFKPMCVLEIKKAR